jgi:hypothetical protein
VCFCENIKSHFTRFNLLITSYDLIVVTELIQATMENIILAKGDYVDLLINDQVIGLGRVESAESGTYYVGERVNAGYVTILIIDVTQPHLIDEDVNEGDIHPWKIMDLRHNIGKSKY